MADDRRLRRRRGYRGEVRGFAAGAVRVWCSKREIIYAHDDYITDGYIACHPVQNLTNLAPGKCIVESGMPLAQRHVPLCCTIQDVPIYVLLGTLA